MTEAGPPPANNYVVETEKILLGLFVFARADQLATVAMSEVTKAKSSVQ